MALTGLQGRGQKVKANGQVTIIYLQLSCPAICICVWLCACICRQTAHCTSPTPTQTDQLTTHLRGQHGIITIINKVLTQDLVPEQETGT